MKLSKTTGLLFFASIICILAVDCRDGEEAAKWEALKTQAAVEAKNLEVARSYVDNFNQGNFEALKELMSPDYAVFSPSGYAEATSRERLIESYEGARGAFSAFRWDLKDIFASGDRVACRIVATGTTKAGMSGLPAEATNFRLSMITILRLKDGKIVEEWQEDDQLGFARQLGMELKPKVD